jgi:dihydroorotate dehydrogenase
VLLHKFACAGPLLGWCLRKQALNIGEILSAPCLQFEHDQVGAAQHRVTSRIAAGLRQRSVEPYILARQYINWRLWWFACSLHTKAVNTAPICYNRRVMLYRTFLRPLLFRNDAETIHERTLALLRLLTSLTPLAKLARQWATRGGQEVELFGLRFPNPLGLAAGMDKNGLALQGWAALGFGFVELGTVTWHPQPGNERPRLFRLPQQGAIINRMGFNNAGASALAQRLANVPWRPFPIGVSIGKSKIAPLDYAIEDYVNSLRAIYACSDYVAINVSSPNTPGLRSLQDRAALDALLQALQRENKALSVAQARHPRPLLVKLAPDLSEQAINELLEVCSDHHVAGLIATNTTLSRAGLGGVPLAKEAGGLSGAPLRERSLAVVRHLARETNGQLPIIGVGGIDSPQAARRMLEAGASLLQIYTGLVYQGPGLVRRIVRSL